MGVNQVAPTVGLKPDWVVITLPTALAIRVFNAEVSLSIIVLLVIIAFVRKADNRFRVQAGPFALLLGACAIVFSRPDLYPSVTAFVLVSALILRLITTVDARKLIASLIDGFGLYLLVNTFCDIAGIRSPSWSDRISTLTETSGFVRTVFPMAGSINSPSIVAAAFLVASIYLLREAGTLRRSLRLVCVAAAVFVIFSSGTRTALAIAIALSIVVTIFPGVSRWIAQISTLFAAISAYVLPAVMVRIGVAVAPIIALSPGRVTTESGVVGLSGREVIWHGAIEYWNEKITALPDMLVGFGQSGQYRSGASSTYVSVVGGTSTNPQFASVHNSFLQQLFDGGILGLLLMVSAVFWASVRLSKRRREWGHWGMSAIVAMSAILLCNTTEATMAPGVFQESFWMLFVLVGISCQTGANPSNDIHGPASRDIDASGTHETRAPEPLDTERSTRS